MGTGDSMSLEVAKMLVYGALHGLSTYIKPGGLHRLKPERLYDEVACNLIIAIDGFTAAYEEGELVRKGSKALTSVELGRLVAKTYREVYRVCGAVHPEYFTPIMVSSIALAHSGVESILSDPGRFKRSLDAVVMSGKWSDIKHYIDTLRSIGRSDISDHLTSTGLTQISLVQAGASYADVFRVLGAKWPGFTLLDPRENLLVNSLKKLVEYYKRARDSGSAVILLYLDLLEGKLSEGHRKLVEEARNLGLMKTQDGARRLYELDITLRKDNISFNSVVEQVVNIAALGALEGVR